MFIADAGVRGMSPLPTLQEHPMSQDHTPNTQDNAADLDTLHDAAEDDAFESIGDHHRMAAHHFSAAAKHHLAAAVADDEGDDEANARHAHLAYRHQLNGVQYAEIAVMDNESLEEAIEDAVSGALMGKPAGR